MKWFPISRLSQTNVIRRASSVSSLPAVRGRLNGCSHHVEGTAITRTAEEGRGTSYKRSMGIGHANTSPEPLMSV